MRLIVANWKHNPVKLADALSLAAGVAAIEPAEDTEVVICPPAPYLAVISEEQPTLMLGAQDVSEQAQGAHTGEIGAALLADLGASYAIIGHSERRALGETDERVAAKIKAALGCGIVPVVCVGEPRDVREQGSDAVRAYLSRQLDAIPAADEIVVAYEPIWAIGTGTADDPASAAATARFIAEYLKDRVQDCRVLYGGSTSPDNAASFLEDEAIAGLLVGGASLMADTFAGIVHAR